MIVRVLGLTRNSLVVPRYSMSLLNDYLSQKQMKKQQAEFKKEMQYLANKPTFTLMDYKQRIEDELNKIKSQFKSKLNNESQEQQKSLEIEKKIMNSMFEEELNLEVKIKYDQKEEMALVTQMPMQQISKIFQKFEEYRTMHRVLRSMRLNNQPLPETVKQLQQLFLMHSASRSNKKFKYHQYKKYTQPQKIRHLKKSHDMEYFL